MPESSERVIEIFSEAIQLPTGERTAFLERACAGDEGLRQKIEDLLRCNDQAGGFLEQPPETVGEVRFKATPGEKPGDRIGRYLLLQQIGEGGCGIVFLAEQREPVRRRVALKVIKPGMDTKMVIARFEAERQALALMDHPNIAKVFDAGATESGRPYFVMELVKGIRITEYCDQNAFSTDARLRLFIQVCEAIQHAHQKGIIHRDIKPSNILVTTGSDGRPTPKVIDFGIAKATMGMELTDKTIFTAHEMLIGTPAYMSPEQAALASVEVDTRTDIYTLGVLLYELLTGTTPFDTRELLKAGFDEVRRVIRDEDPVRPSTRLSTMVNADLVIVSKRHGEDPPKLIRRMRGDLDWIVMKAMEKDRTRRYATANGLAMDVQRYLSGEPIVARPPSAHYRLQKLVQRNKVVFAAIGVVTFLLVVSLIIVSTSLATEKKAHQQALAASATSQQITSFLTNMLDGVGPAAASGRDTTLLREILDHTLAHLDQTSNQPVAKAEICAIVGKVYEQLGMYARSEEMERTALAIRQQQFGPDSLEAAASLNDLGLALMSERRPSEAAVVHAQALAIRRRLLGEDNLDTAASLNDLGAAYRDEGKITEAESLVREALQIRMKFLGLENLDTADSLRNLTILLGTEKRWAEAKENAEQVLAIRQKLLGSNHIYVASALQDVAWAASGLGQYGEAERVETASLLMRTNLLDEAHPDIGRNLNALGQLLKNRGELPTADAVLKATLSIQRKIVGDSDPATLDTLHALSEVLASEGKPAEAEAVAREALTLWRTRGDDQNELKLYTMRILAESLESQGKWQEAEAVWREALPMWRKRGGDEEQQSMYTLRKLGLALQAEHKLPEAELVWREALSISGRKGDQDSEALADRERLVRLLADEKRYTEGLDILDKVLTPAFVTQPTSASLLAEKIGLMARQGKWSEAVACAAVAVENQPTEHYNYHMMAVLLVVTGQRAAYEQLCKTLLPKFADTANPYVAERVAQDCLLLPDSGVDLQLTDKLADTAVNRGSGESALPYFQAAKAMAQYRLGHFREAIDWAQKTVNSPAVEGPAKAKALAVLAMAHWQLGQKDDARAALAGGDAITPKIRSERGETDPGDSWMAWLLARISLDEAAALMEPGKAAENTPGATRQ